MLNSEHEAKLNQFIAMEDNWDGHNAPKLSAESVISFKNFLNSIHKLHGDIVPESVVDESFLSWYYEDEDVYVDCLFLKGNKVNMYLHFKDDKNSVGLENIDIIELKETLQKFAPKLVN